MAAPLPLIYGHSASVSCQFSRQRTSQLWFSPTNGSSLDPGLMSCLYSFLSVFSHTICTGMLLFVLASVSWPSCRSQRSLSPRLIISHSLIGYAFQLLGDSTEQMSAKLGQTVAGLLNASFGNAVEIIVGIAALLQGQSTRLPPRSLSMYSLPFQMKLE